MLKTVELALDDVLAGSFQTLPQNFTALAQGIPAVKLVLEGFAANLSTIKVPLMMQPPADYTVFMSSCTCSSILRFVYTVGHFCECARSSIDVCGFRTPVV